MALLLSAEVLRLEEVLGRVEVIAKIQGAIRNTSLLKLTQGFIELHDNFFFQGSETSSADSVSLVSNFLKNLEENPKIGSEIECLSIHYILDHLMSYSIDCKNLIKENLTLQEIQDVAKRKQLEMNIGKNFCGKDRDPIISKLMIPFTSLETAKEDDMRCILDVFQGGAYSKFKDPVTQALWEIKDHINGGKSYFESRLKLNSELLHLQYLEM